MGDKKLVERINELLRLFEKIKNVDEFTCKTGAAATVFVHIGNDFLRSSTTVPNYDGKAATGTVLDHGSEAYQKLLRGKSFTGYAELFGKTYFSKYQPYFTDRKGVVIALYVGILIDKQCNKKEIKVLEAEEEIFQDKGYQYHCDLAVKEKAKKGQPKFIPEDTGL